MKLIIAGTRTLSLLDAELADAVLRFIRDNHKPPPLPDGPIQSYVTEVVSGTSRGIDKLGELWADRHGIPVKRFPANWDSYGRSAGPLRNREMAAYADGALILWDGKSRGAENMYKTMKILGKPALCITYAT